MQIILATFEHLPIRVGGLAEAATSLAYSLTQEGVEVLVFMPSHSLHKKKEKELSIKALTHFSLEVGNQEFPTSIYQGSCNGVKLYLFSNDILDREEVYGPPHTLLFEKVAHFAKAVPAFLNWQIKTQGKKPDIFHSNDWHPLLAAELTKKYFRIPYLYTIHRICNPQIPVNFLQERGLEPILDPQFTREHLFHLEVAGASGCKLLNTVSLTYLEEEWERFFKNYEGKCTYVWNGIDATFWDPEKLKNPNLSRSKRKEKLLTENGLNNGTLFFYVGRLDFEQKGVEHFLNAIEKVMSNSFEEKQNLRFVVLGSGDKQLEEKIHQLQAKYPKNVKGILGYLEREVTREYYASADFCVIPSNFEPFGLVQLEAMCLGSIPLGTKVGGINDTVVDAFADSPKATGCLVPPHNPEALAHAIEKVAAWVQEKPEWVEKIRTNGRPHVTTNFTWAKAARRYLELYQDKASMKISFARYKEAF